MGLTAGRGLLVVALVVLSAACGGSDRSAGSPRETDLPTELQRILDQAVIRSNGLGVAAAVVAEGHEPWMGAAGHSVGAETEISMTPDMLFEVGSIGKTFVTTLLMQLVDEGAVSLDDPLSKWISGYPQLNPSITLRHLVASTSGIPEWVDHPSSPFRMGIEKSRAWLARSWTVDDMLTELVGQGEFLPGAEWRYSTTGFRLAREVLTLQTGKPISDLIQTRLLDRLGIDGMWLTPTWPIPPNIKVAHEWYDLDGDGNLDDITAIPKTAFEDLKDAPVYSNALDLARFCQGLFHDRALVSDKSLAAMLDFRPVYDPAEPVAAQYGLGVGVFRLPNLGGLEHYGHGGYGFGYIALMLYLPQHKASVVLLTNDGGATMSAAAEAFLRAVDSGL